MPSCPIPAGPRRRSGRRAGSVAQALLGLALLGAVASPARAAVALDPLRLPPGFRVELVTDAVPNARQMALGRSGDGWLKGESAWGRPADVLVRSDGSLLVSDDRAGAIYRIRYAP
jgi:hypothetical protein